MREHGLLNRLLLIYDEHLRMLAAKRSFDGSLLVSAADIIRHFVEEYHENWKKIFSFRDFARRESWSDWLTPCKSSIRRGAS